MRLCNKKIVQLTKSYKNNYDEEKWKQVMRRHREETMRRQGYYAGIGQTRPPLNTGNPLSAYRQRGGKFNTPGRSPNDVVIRKDVTTKMRILSDLKAKYRKCKNEHERIQLAINNTLIQTPGYPVQTDLYQM